jgi:hypothetical protein
MKPEHENEDELRKILSLKRREQPPAKFFQSLPHQIINRLHTPEPPRPPTLWQRMGLDFDAKPVLVCVAGVVVCLLLVGGLISSRHVDPPAPPAAADQNSPLQTPTLSGTMGQPAPTVSPITRPEDMRRSVDPVLARDASSPNEFTVRPKPVGLNSNASGK